MKIVGKYILGARCIFVHTGFAMYIVDMPTFIGQLLWAAFLLTITHMGTTALALGAGWVRNVVEYRRRAMTQQASESPSPKAKKHWLKKWWHETRPGIQLTMGLWLLLFLYCCFEAAYQRYKPLAEETHNLQTKLNELENYRKNKEQYDRDLAYEKGEVRHWQDAFEREAKGETVPDRILSHEEENSLYDALYLTSKNPKNKDYATLYMGAVQDREARHLWTQLDRIFRNAHWSIPLNSKIDKKVWDTLINSAPIEIVIYSDDMSKGTFLMFTLHNTAHLNSTVLPDAAIGVPGFKGTLIWIGYKQPLS